MHARTLMHAHAHTRTRYKYKYTYILYYTLHIYTYTFMNEWMHIMHLHINKHKIYIETYTGIHTRKNTRTHARTHARTYTHTHTHTHTHTGTRTRTRTRAGKQANTTQRKLSSPVAWCCRRTPCRPVQHPLQWLSLMVFYTVQGLYTLASKILSHLWPLCPKCCKIKMPETRIE